MNYTEEEKRMRYNFVPFKSQLTHRMEFEYSFGVTVSCPANFNTDEEAKECMRECVKNDKEKAYLVSAVVRKYENGSCNKRISIRYYRNHK